MAFKVVNDIVIKNNTNINVDGMEVLVGDGDPNTKVLLKDVQLTTNVLSDSNLTTDNLTEGTTNLYYSNTRVLNDMSSTIATITSDITTGDANTLLAAQLYADSVVSSSTGSLTTDDIPEGSNLYYTDARADARIPTTLSSFTNDSNFATVAYTDQAETDANSYTDTREVAITTAYTSAIAAASSAGSSGSNSYTDQEVANAITTMTAYTDQAESDANAYTDTRETAITSAYQSYANQAEVDAVVTSNNYTDTQISQLGDTYYTETESNNLFVNVSGDTMTGALVLSGAPVNLNDATTKSYVDSVVATGTGALTTDDIPEASNLYYTDVRAQSAITGGTGINVTNGVVSVGQDVAKTSDVEFHDVLVTGDLTVNGTTTTVLSETTRINKNLLYLNEGGESTITGAVGNGTTVTYTADNTYSVGYTVDITGVNPSSFDIVDGVVTAADGTSFTVASTVTGTYVSGGEAYGHAHVNVDLGLVGAYDDGTYAHAGFFRDATDGRFKVFDSYTVEPSAAVNIDTAHASFNLADIQASTFIGNLTGDVTGNVTGNLSGSGGSVLVTNTGPADAELSIFNITATGIISGNLTGNVTGNVTGDVNGTVSTLSNHTTTNLAEGTNLYYTDARVDARIPNNVSSFTNDENYIAKDISSPQHWVDLGNNTALYWGTSNTNITGFTGTIDMKPNGTGVASFETTGLVINLLKDIRYQKNNNVYTTLDFAGTVNSSNETIIIPDASGTMALTSDLTNLVTQVSLEQHIGDSSVDGTIGNTVYHRILTSKNQAIADANSYTDTEIAALPSIPVNVSAFNNDSNYSTFTSNQGTDTTDHVRFESIEINTNNQTAETDLILNANSVIGGNNSINMALTDTGGTFRWWIGTTDHATGTAGGSTYMTLNSTELSVTGEIVASGDVCAYSDRRLKRNIETIDNALDKVNSLRGVTFEKGLKPSLGVIAQEVEEVLPELVKTDEDGMKSVAYGNIVGLLIEAIKEQQIQIEELKNKCKDL